MVPLTTPSRVCELCSFITEKQNLQVLLMSLPYSQRSGVVKAYLPITTVTTDYQVYRFSTKYTKLEKDYWSLIDAPF